jgi:hypothetical protein
MLTSLDTAGRARHSPPSAVMLRSTGVRAAAQTQKLLISRFPSHSGAHGVTRTTRLARTSLQALTALLISMALVCKGDDLADKGRAISTAPARRGHSATRA